MATSYNGYPAIKDSSECKKWRIPVGKGPERHLILAPYSPGFVLAHFAAWFDKKIEDINEERTWDDWGWAYRNTRGANSLSNHASGTAIDLNATRHPLGQRGTFSRWQATKIRWKLRVRYRGCIRWGGDYKSRADEMHFEINRPRKDVARLATKLRRTKRGKKIKEMNP